MQFSKKIMPPAIFNDNLVQVKFTSFLFLYRKRSSFVCLAPLGNIGQWALPLLFNIPQPHIFIMVKHVPLKWPYRRLPPLWVQEQSWMSNIVCCFFQLLKFRQAPKLFITDNGRPTQIFVQQDLHIFLFQLPS